ncbi:hypothetical protein KFU94_28410 [Chloroflexi bacterium TSY]|nr:hypothetical protein [Chloroflexi bacterium TSY]
MLQQSQGKYIQPSITKGTFSFGIDSIEGWEQTSGSGIVEKIEEQGTTYSNPYFPMVGAVDSLYKVVNQLSRRLQSLADELHELSLCPKIYTIPIYDLDSSEVSLKHTPLFITIEEYLDEYIARFVDTETYGSGGTEADAIADMKEQLLELYEDLHNSSDDTLAGPAIKWKRLLESLLDG